MKILGIDPGKDGAFVLLGESEFRYFLMPHKDDGDLDFELVQQVLRNLKPDHIFLERAMAMAMGSKHAFNYGRSFAALEIAIKLSMIPVTYVEPSRWAKVMHDGISKDLKTKVKSKIAAERLFPVYFELIPRTPKSKAVHEGVLEALLIAEYGRRIIR